MKGGLCRKQIRYLIMAIQQSMFGRLQLDMNHDKAKHQMQLKIQKVDHLTQYQTRADCHGMDEEDTQN